jgi:hypothetical protein
MMRLPQTSLDTAHTSGGATVRGGVSPLAEERKGGRESAGNLRQAGHEQCKEKGALLEASPAKSSHPEAAQPKDVRLSKTHRRRETHDFYE